MRSNGEAVIGLAASLCLLVSQHGAMAATRSSPQSTMRLATEATLYALPIVIMDIARTETLAYPGAEPDRFFNRPVLANANSRTVVRPNVDTLYSTAWLDLFAQPMILTLPPSHGRFFVV